MQPDPVYVDTSAFYALMDRSDPNHHSAKNLWPVLLEDHFNLCTSNYIVCESLDLIQHRLGYEAGNIWYKNVLAVLDVYWVDLPIHKRAYDLWISLGRHRHTLIDCISYVIMNKNQIEKAFSFNHRLADQGFMLLTKIGCK
jgi:uncharacterized protein